LKAAAFEYCRAESAAHALELLDLHGAGGKLVAGGQSLVPMMAMRLVRPTLLIDIFRLAELKTIDVKTDAVRIGACVRQRDIEDATALHARLPLVRKALRWVGHGQTRNRGTIGGSLAHADPSAELPLAALVLGATMRLASKSAGERQVDSSEFFLGPMMTATSETECLTAVDWPIWPARRTGCAFEEISIRHGDFAMVSAACQVELDEGGACRRASIGLGAVGGTPLAFADLSRQLVGRRIDAGAAREVAHAAARRCDPGSDMHAGADYRREMAATLLERALLQASQEARAANG
jgi:CO/xanthine dehydrogenase FAD-binding subunit